MTKQILKGLLIDEQTELTLKDLSHACSCSAEWIIELVEHGAIEPLSFQQTQWRFSGSSLRRAQTAMHLQRDLGINLPGVALALDLLEQIESLESRLCRFENLHDL